MNNKDRPENHMEQMTSGNLDEVVETVSRETSGVSEGKSTGERIENEYEKWGPKDILKSWSIIPCRFRGKPATDSDLKSAGVPI